METIYHHKEIKDVDDLRYLASICHDPPEDRCVCNKCFRYEITIDKIEEIKRDA